MINYQLLQEKCSEATQKALSYRSNYKKRNAPDLRGRKLWDVTLSKFLELKKDMSQDPRSHDRRKTYQINRDDSLQGVSCTPKKGWECDPGVTCGWCVGLQWAVNGPLQTICFSFMVWRNTEESEMTVISLRATEQHDATGYA